MRERLDKRVAARSGRSRSEVVRAIRKGRVTVDGAVVTDPARPIRDEEVALDEVVLAAPPRLAVFHKPFGVHSTLSDDQGRSSLATAASELVGLGLHPVGRLDAETTGLLLFSSDGVLTQHLLHPKRALRRIYVARVEGRPAESLKDVLAAGVKTSDGVFTGDLLELEGDRLVLAVTEGKHRMVRRMLANAGHPVVDLARIAYGPFQLGDLPDGAWRLPTDEELAALNR
ncbi:MAG: rRNA pseudouridine synthase [Myxococcales bacterium]|nr:rRNA pseudouridine synthase [Myxococcales bacterium]